MSNVEKLANPLTPQHLTEECHRIADWWLAHSVDNQFGGFYGAINNNNESNDHASKGIIQNTRILWFFSVASRKYNDARYRKMATRAYHYLMEHFWDGEEGGVFWELDYHGSVINSKKQTYAQAFSIYALAAYYRATHDENAIGTALTLFKLIEQHAVDKTHGGYLEAFTRQWTALSDVRLSEKDKNSPKTMNTHIHVLEAYTELYRATNNTFVKQALAELVKLICETILDKDTCHLRLFQQLDWTDNSDCYSYGHDIECSWLLKDALKALDDVQLTSRYLSTVMNIADTCLEQAIGDMGQVCDHFNLIDKQKHPESEWWVQAEALVGFLNAYLLTGSKDYLNAAEEIWSFTQEQHFDLVNGEWFWSAKRDKSFDHDHYKAGFWKGPYHNGRAMMEAADLLEEITLSLGSNSHAIAN